MLGGLFKPKWQHHNARIRIQALASLGSDSPELIQLAQNDPNTGVRLEAIVYLTDLPTLIQLGKRNDSVGERAKHRVLELVASDNSQDEQLLDVFAWLGEKPSLLKGILRDGERHVELRKLALEKLDDEALFFKVANEDSSREMRYLAAARITDIDKLKKLEKTQGRANKKLRQLLKERMATQQEEQAFLGQLEQYCEALENLGQSGNWAQDKTQHKVLQQSWKSAGEQAGLPEALEKRFHDAECEFLGRLDSYEQQQEALQPLFAEFAACLQAADELKKTMQEHPEELTLRKIDERLEQLQERWVTADTLPDEQQEPLNQRWIAEFVALTEQRDALSGDLEALEQLKKSCDRAERLRDSNKPLRTRDLTALQGEWVKIKRPVQAQEAVSVLEGHFHQIMDSLNARLQREAKEREEKLQVLRAELEQMETDLEEEKYGEAVDIHRRLTDQLKGLQDIPAKERNEIDRRLRAAAPMVMEFKDWRRWGTDQAREHLIETAQRLENDETMDPQQRAKEIKALRQEWRKLVQMEPGQQRKQWKDFDSKVTAAYEPSKQHFKEQARQREEHLKQREGICIQLETMAAVTDWEHVDWKAQYAGINELRKAWKRCGTVGHKDWKRINKRFNDAIDALDVHLQGERERNLRERERLMEQSQLLAEELDVNAAVSQAKALQSQWQITIPSRPRVEQKLWKQFRGPIDEVFKRLKQERQSKRSATDQRIHDKQELVEQLESWLKMPDESFQQATRNLDKVRREFDALRDIPKAVYRKLEDRFNSAEQAVISKQDHLHWQQKLAGLDELATASADLKTEGAEGNGEANQLEGERICLQLEILLDIASPEEFQQSRMEYQISQMSEAMLSRSENMDVKEQALELLENWYRLGAMPAETLAFQQQRIERVRQAIAK